MALPLALPLAPVVAPGASAAAATFLLGSAAYLASGYNNFRRGAPGLPPLTGREHLPSLRELVADAIAGAQVPVGFPLPPPWNPYRGLAPLVAAVALQLWGWLNSRPLSAPPTGAPTQWQATGKVGANGGSVRIHITAIQLQRSCTINASTQCYGPALTSTQNSLPTPYGAGGGGVVSASLETFRVCGYSTASVKLAKGTAAPGNTINASFISSVNTPACGDIISYSVLLEYTNPSGAQLDPVLPSYPSSPPSGYEPPQAKPERLTVPKALPLPEVMPLVPAPVPGAEPVTQPEPAPATPGTVPAAPPLTAPRPLAPPLVKPAPATALPVDNGWVRQPEAAPVPTTDPDAIYPIPGRPPLVGNGPQANLQDMAKELGRIEAKLHGLLNPTPEFNPVPQWINDLGQAVTNGLRILELLQASQAGGSYLLSGPCEVDPGETPPPPREAFYAGGLGWLEVINNKVDALAELQQHAKDLKQPICRPRPQGQPVQVTFIEQQ